MSTIYSTKTASCQSAWENILKFLLKDQLGWNLNTILKHVCTIIPRSRSLKIFWHIHIQDNEDSFTILSQCFIQASDHKDSRLLHMVGWLSDGSKNTRTKQCVFKIVHPIGFRAGTDWLYWTEVKILLYIDSTIWKGLNLGTGGYGKVEKESFLWSTQRKQKKAVLLSVCQLVDYKTRQLVNSSSFPLVNLTMSTKIVLKIIILLHISSCAQLAVF